MTLGNMRANGVRSLTVYCSACPRVVVFNVDAYPEAAPVPAFGPRTLDRIAVSDMTSTRKPVLQRQARIQKWPRVVGRRGAAPHLQLPKGCIEARRIGDRNAGSFHGRHRVGLRWRRLVAAQL